MSSLSRPNNRREGQHASFRHRSQWIHRLSRRVRPDRARSRGARSGPLDAAAAKVSAAGATPVRGSIEDVDSLRRGAAQAEGAIHTAFFHEFSHASRATRLRILLGGSPRAIVTRFLSTSLAADRAAITTIGTALRGDDRPLVAAFGTLALTPGHLATEDDAVDPASVGGPRGATERVIDELATGGARASAVRFPPIVHGDDDHGFLSRLIDIATKNKVSGYAGDGANRWPSVHRSDAARLLVTALEKGEPGARYHGVADEGVPFIDIASAIGRRLDVPVESATPREIAARYSFLAMFLGVDNPVSSALTTRRLGWTPTGPSLLEDIDWGTYFGSGVSA